MKEIYHDIEMVIYVSSTVNDDNELLLITACQFKAYGWCVMQWRRVRFWKFKSWKPFWPSLKTVSSSGVHSHSPSINLRIRFSVDNWEARRIYWELLIQEYFKGLCQCTESSENLVFWNLSIRGVLSCTHYIFPWENCNSKSNLLIRG